MKINVQDYYKLINEYYGERKYYWLENDFNLTYQEYLLIVAIEQALKCEIKEIESDTYNFEESDVIAAWYDKCVAQFYQKPIIDKPWNKVLKKEKKEPNIIIKENYEGYQARYFHVIDFPPYSEIMNKRKELNEIKNKEYWEKEERRLKMQKEKQRAYRARKKNERK